MTFEQPSEPLIKDELNQKFHAALCKRRRKKDYFLQALLLFLTSVWIADRP